MTAIVSSSFSGPMSCCNRHCKFKRNQSYGMNQFSSFCLCPSLTCKFHLIQLESRLTLLLALSFISYHDNVTCDSLSVPKCFRQLGDLQELHCADCRQSNVIQDFQCMLALIITNCVLVDGNHHTGACWGSFCNSETSISPVHCDL